MLTDPDMAREAALMVLELKILLSCQHIDVDAVYITTRDLTKRLEEAAQENQPHEGDGNRRHRSRRIPDTHYF